MSIDSITCSPIIFSFSAGIFSRPILSWISKPVPVSLSIKISGILPRPSIGLLKSNLMILPFGPYETCANEPLSNSNIAFVPAASRILARSERLDVELVSDIRGELLKEENAVLIPTNLVNPVM